MTIEQEFSRQERSFMNDNQSQELLPCPFCGGQAKESFYYGDRKIQCEDCGVYVMNPDAIKDWNTRHTPTSPTDLTQKGGDVKMQEPIELPKHLTSPEQRRIVNALEGNEPEKLYGPVDTGEQLSRGDSPLPDDLAKAIEAIVPHYDFANVVSEQGKTGILWTLFETIPFASRRIASFATESDARYFIETCRNYRTLLTAAKQVQELRERLKRLTETHGSLLVALEYNRKERDGLKEQIQKLEQSSRDDKEQIDKLTDSGESLSSIVWSCCQDGQHSPERDYCIPGKRFKEALQLAHSKGYGKK